ncbi:hypothetical protein U1Q18_019246 [Sarracenia purpurea var. burkii]
MGGKKGSGGSGRSSWAVAVPFLTVAVALVVASELRVAGADNLTPSQCRDERQLGIKECKPVMFGAAPSAACCVRMRVSHVECACPVIDPKLAAILTLDRVVKLLRTCGRAVPHKFQCGSLYFP